MAGEAVSEICTSIAEEVRALRARSEPTSVALNGMLAHLCNASATTAVDALALAAMSRRVLAAEIGEYEPADLQFMHPARFQSIFALDLLHRAIQTLEAETGLSAEGFTGEVDAVN